MREKTKTSKKKKECGTPRCALPALEYLDGKVIIFNEHHGKKHINFIDLDWIIEQAVLDGKSKQILEKIRLCV